MEYREEGERTPGRMRKRKVKKRKRWNTRKKKKRGLYKEQDDAATCRKDEEDACKGQTVEYREEKQRNKRKRGKRGTQRR